MFVLPESVGPLWRDSGHPSTQPTPPTDSREASYWWQRHRGINKKWKFKKLMWNYHKVMFWLILPWNLFWSKVDKNHLSSKYWRSQWDWEQVLTEFGKNWGIDGVILSSSIEQIILTFSTVYVLCSPVLKVFWSVELVVVHIRRRLTNDVVQIHTHGGKETYLAKNTCT